MEPGDLSATSWVVAAGRDHTPGAPLNVPLIPASNFAFGGDAEYARDDGTATWSAFEALVGGLEGGSAVMFASGMAAAAAVFDQLPADAVIALPADCYQGVSALLAAGEAKGRWKVQRIAVDDTAAWMAAANSVDLVWLESPSNPLLIVADVPAICGAPRKPGTLVAVDNTFATPLNQQPLAVGADISIHSATKLIGGHSDLLAGVAVTGDDQLLEQLRQRRKLAGATPGALEAYLALRGARTLAIRLERSQQNALELAQRLAAHRDVDRVRYPGLPDDPGHGTAQRVLGGFGAVISFDVAGDAGDADEVCRRVALIRHATSLGGVESTMERRAAIPGQHHLPPTLLRLSVGCEDVEDLWSDLSQALTPA